MKSFLSDKYIKLGTAIRYLIMVQEGEQLAGNRVIGNIEVVLRLLDELEFTNCNLARLQGLLGEFNAAAANQTLITKEQADRLEAVCRKLRSAIFAEAGSKTVYTLSKEEAEAVTSSGWPKELTLPLLAKTPFSIWKWLVGLVIATFLFGIYFAQTNLYQTIAEAFDSPESPPQDIQVTEGDEDA